MPSAVTIEPLRPTLRRSAELFAAFRHEQDRPDDFYRALARDTVSLVARHCAVPGSVVLDVGAGPGYFGAAFAAAGARYLAVDADAREIASCGAAPAHTVLGDGARLPVRSGAVDVCLSSNVLEHVRGPWDVAAEMLRVTRPGGHAVIAFTLWWGPWGGHETAPWHLLGGARAADRYARRHGRRPKNDFGRTLFPVTAGAALRWARGRRDAELVEAFPRYLPTGTWWLRSVPLVREVVLWNLCLVLRRRDPV